MGREAKSVRSQLCANIGSLNYNLSELDKIIVLGGERDGKSYVFSEDQLMCMILHLTNSQSLTEDIELIIDK